MPDIPFACALSFAPGLVVATDPSGTVDLGAPDGNLILLQGTDPVDSFGTAANKFRFVLFADATPLVNSAALLLRGGVSRTARPNELTLFLADAAANWHELSGGDWRTGDAKLTMQASAETGWIMMDDGTLGDAGSGASNRADPDTHDLFVLLYGLADADVPLTTSAGGATTRGAQGSAAMAWGNKCRIALPKALGRALAVAGAGSGLTARALGATVGEEKHAQTTTELAAHDHAENVDSSGATSNRLVKASGNATPGDSGVRTGSSGSGAAANVMQPTTFFNVTVKL
jgi:hypothetical protein